MSPTAEAKTPGTVQLAGDVVISEAALLKGLRLTEGALAAARESGLLKFARIGNRRVYRGQWVRRWLESVADRPQGGAA